jgi:hypothetical protein
MKRFTIIISCILALNAYGQNQLGPVLRRPIVLEAQTDTLGRFQYRLQNPKADLPWSRLNSNDPEFTSGFTSFIPLQTREGLLLVENQGGKVFALKDSIIQRIDHSFTHKNQINSVLFQRNDTLFRFGGYGYFSAKHFMTYFAPQTKEWEYYLTRSKVHPPGLFTAKFIITDERLVVFGGQILNPSNPYEFEPNQEIWSFSFTDKRWTQLGKMKSFELLKHQPSDLQVGDTLFFIEEGNLYGFASAEGALLKYPQKNTYLKHIPQSSMSIEGSKISYLIQHKQSPVVSRWITEPLTHELEQVTTIENAYWDFRIGWYLLIALLLSFFIWWIWPNKKLHGPEDFPSLSDGLLIYKRKKVPLNPDEVSFMRLFLDRDQVMVSDMIDLLSDRKMVYSQKMKLKDDIVASLNNKLFFLTDSDAFQVVSEKNLEDKRMRLYHLKTPAN